MSIERIKQPTIYRVQYEGAAAEIPEGYEGETAGPYVSTVALHRLDDETAVLTIQDPDGQSQVVVNPDQILALANTYVKDARQKEKHGA